MDKMLRAAVLCLLFALAGAQQVFGQTYGAEMPWASMNFLGLTGAVIPNGKLCSYINNTTTKQDTYTTSDISGTGTKNANPIIMNSLGRPTTNGIYMIAAKYTFVLMTAGTDTTCATGTVIWTANDIFNMGQLLAAGLVSFTSINNKQFCSTGANFGVEYAAAAALLPSTGGVVDCSNLQGPQSVASDVFTGVTKPVSLIWPSGTVSSSVSLSIPVTTSIYFDQGGILSQAVATTSTVFDVSGTDSQHFAGSGAIQITGSVPVKAIWFPGSENGAKVSAAAASLSSSGGIVDAASGMTGAQTMSTQVVIATSNISVNFGCATWTLSGVVPVNSPGPSFVAANFQVNGASNVWFKGTHGCTVMKTAAGEKSNVFTFYNNLTALLVGGGVLDIEGDGNKANNTAGSDDTFQSFVHIISTTNATADARIVVDHCIIHDFIHYGVVTYGAFASSNTVSHNFIYSNGKVGDANSTGDGIFINLGSSRNLVEGNHTYGNKRSGIRVSSAGTTGTDNHIFGNWSSANTIDGIQADEETSLGSVSGAGESGLEIIGNHTYGNASAGIHITASDTTGFILGCAVTANITTGNVYGVLVQSGAGTSAVSDVSQCSVTNNQAGNNSSTGIFIGSGTLDTYVNGNTAIGNGTPLTDNGTRTRASCNVLDVTSSFCNTPMVTNDAGTLLGDTGVVIKAVVLSGGTGTITLTGSGVYSGSGNYACIANDLTTAANAVTLTHTSASVISIVGTGSDTVTVACLGLKN